MTLICRTIFGSHLYGTATATSDLDIRGIFLPSTREILLGRIPKTKSEPGDVEYYSLHHFIKLALEGQTVALDMLFSPHMVVDLKLGYIWRQIFDNREKLLSKSINAFIGYARTQASKYSLKGDRLNKLIQFRDVISSGGGVLGNIIDHPDLPRDEDRINPNGIREIQIAGKWFGETTNVTVIGEAIEKQIKRYGNRAKMASATLKDWKALGHAVRVAYECSCILKDHEIRFPLQISQVLTHIKLGQVSYEEVQELIEHYIEECEKLKAVSRLPEKPDYKFWEDWLVEVIKNEI